jgi:hypothetical protein
LVKVPAPQLLLSGAFASGLPIVTAAVTALGAARAEATIPIISSRSVRGTPPTY